MTLPHPDADVTEISQLVSVSRRYGGDPAFVVAGGGNTSCKQPSRLWVKASGHALASIDANGFVELDRAALQAMLAGQWPADPKEREAAFIKAVMAARVHPELGQRPSVEALLHHLLPGRFVVHTHPGLVNALTCCVDGPAIAAELFGNDVLWQPYVDPGLVLAQTLHQSLLQYRHRAGHDPIAILLKNHGLFVSADAIETIDNVTQGIVRAISQRLDSVSKLPFESTNYPRRPELLQRYIDGATRLAPGLHVSADKSEGVMALVGSSGGRDVAMCGPLTPDQIVYCRSVPVWIETPSDDARQIERQWHDAWNNYIHTHGFEPWVALIAGVGMVAMRTSTAMAEVTRSMYADAARVYRDAQRLGGARPLSLRDRKFIEDWEVEAFRRAVSAQKKD